MRLIDLKRCSEEVSLSVFTLRKFTRAGMPHYRVGKKILVDIDEFRAWFAAQFRENIDERKNDLSTIIDEAVAAVMK